MSDLAGFAASVSNYNNDAERLADHSYGPDPSMWDRVLSAPGPDKARLLAERPSKMIAVLAPVIFVLGIPATLSLIYMMLLAMAR